MSKVFCPLAWNSLSILPDGRLRLCCHTNEDHLLKSLDGRDIKLDDILKVEDLDTNLFLKNVRREFSNGNSIPACAPCLDSENIGHKSIRNELNEQFHQVSKDSKFKLEFLDVSFGNTCNMQCPMCSPNYSSLWAGITDKARITKSHNKNFWNSQFFIEQQNHLKSILIQGGEPFMAKEHKPFLHTLIKAGVAKNIKLDYITNFTIPISNEQIALWKEFKFVNIFVSIEGVGNIYNYTRPPFKWEKIKNNLQKIHELINTEDLNINFNFKSLIQLYNLEGLLDLIDFTNSFKSDKVEAFPEFNILTYPLHLRIDQLNKVKKDQVIREILDNITSLKNNYSGKSLQNYHQLQSILESELNKEQGELDINFWRHTKYFDIKYSTSFKDIISYDQYEYLKKNIK
jgi:MoaA/NifB/PqqE/SkfB family radical SAM enzyme